MAANLSPNKNARMHTARVLKHGPYPNLHHPVANGPPPDDGEEKRERERESECK